MKKKKLFIFPFDFFAGDKIISRLLHFHETKKTKTFCTLNLFWSEKKINK